MLRHGEGSITFRIPWSPIGTPSTRLTRGAHVWETSSFALAGESAPIDIEQRYPGAMTHDEAMAEVERRRTADPGASWIATERDGDWVVVRIGVAPTKVTGTATKPPPVAPQGDPHSAIERAAWFAGGGLG